MIITNKKVLLQSGQKIIIPPFTGWKKVNVSRKDGLSVTKSWRSRNHALLRLYIPEDATVVCVDRMRYKGIEPKLQKMQGWGNRGDAEWKIVMPRPAAGAGVSFVEGKMRANKVEVVAAYLGTDPKSKQLVYPDDYIFTSFHTTSFEYVVGKTASAKLDLANEQCAGGIHFYMTKARASRH